MADLRLNIIGNAESANRAMNQVARNVANQAKSMAKSFAVDQAKDFFGGMVSAARESEKVMKLTENAIKATGGAAGVTADQVADLAGSIAAKTGVDDEAIQTASNMLLAFKKVRNEVGKGNNVFDQATEIATDMSVALGTDLAGNAKLLGKALNDPEKGMNALRKAGVSFDEATKDQIVTLSKSGKTIEAQKLLLSELQKRYGGAAAAAATPADKMKVAWGNLQETLGAKVIPALNKVINVGLKVVEWLQENERVVKPVAIGLAVLAVTIKAITVATRAWTAVQAAFNVVMALNPIGLIVVGLVALGAALFAAYKKSETFRNIVDGVWKAVSGYFKTAWDVMSAVFESLKIAIESVGKVWTTLKDTTLRVIGTIVEKFLGFVQTIVGLAADAFGWVPGVGEKLKGAEKSIEDFRKKVELEFGLVNKAPAATPKVDLGQIQTAKQAVSELIGLLQNVAGGAVPAPTGPNIGVGALIPKGQTRAMGGRVTKGVPYLVGERRAEIFTPNVNGYIQPDASRWMNGKTIHIEKFEQHNHNPVAETVPETEPTAMRRMALALGNY